MVLPAIPFQTRVVPQRVLVDRDGRLLQAAEPEDDMAAVEVAVDPAAAAQRRVRRAFWDRFIREARFDHPDQPPPRHGGDNWVRIDLPPPGWITAYRSGDRAGVFVRLAGEGAAEAYDNLLAERAALEAEIGQALRFGPTVGKPGVFEVEATHVVNPAEGAVEDAQRAWLLDTANRFVTALRPRLAARTA